MNCEKYLEEKIDIQSQLISIFSNDEVDKDTLFNEIIQKLEILNARKDQNEFRSFLHLISQISNSHHRTSSFRNTITKIITAFQNEFKKFLSNDEIYNFFCKNKLVLLLLIQKQILIVDQNIVDDMLTKETYPNYFFNEIKPFLNKTQIKKIEDENKLYEVEDFEKARQIGENHQYICKLIREDLIKEFIVHINKTNLPVNSAISQSIFETNSFLLHSDVTLIKYAAFFGSIQVYNYLRHNKAILPQSLWLYTIHGKNAELIHLLEEDHVLPTDQTYKKCFEESIKCHHNDFAEYFKNNFLSQKLCEDKSNQLISINYYNYKYISNPMKSLNIYIFFQLCSSDYFFFVQEILKNNRIKVNYKIKPPLWVDSACLFTPLHIALYNNNVGIAKILLSRPECNVKLSSILNQKCKGKDMSTLELGVLTNNAEIVNLILKRKEVDVNKISLYKKEDEKKIVFREKLPLTTAIINKNLEIVKLLLSHPNIDVNVVQKKYVKNKTNSKYHIENVEEETPLYIAVKNNLIEIVKLLLNNSNINVNIKGFYSSKDIKKYETPLSLAINNNYFEIVQLLLSNPKIDVNLFSKFYNFDNDKHGVLTSKKKSKLTPLYSACFHNNIEIVKLLMKCSSLDINLISKEIIYNINNSNRYDENSWNEYTSLSVSIINKNNKIANLLLTDNKIDVNIVTTFQNNSTIIKYHPLVWAIDKNTKNDNKEIIENLLNHSNIDLNIQNFYSDYDKEEYFEPLYFAVLRKNVHVIEMMINNPNCDINSKFVYKYINNRERKEISVLNYALENKMIDISLLLLSNPKILLNEKSFQIISSDTQIIEKERTTMDYAINSGSLEVVQLLLSNDNINIHLCSTIFKSTWSEKSFEETTNSLKIALKFGNIEIFQLFAEYAINHSKYVDWEGLMSMTYNDEIKSLIYSYKTQAIMDE